MRCLHAQVTLAKDAPVEELEKAKQHVKDQGGEIVSEFSLIKGFTYATFIFFSRFKQVLTPRSAKIPDDAVSVLKSNDKITVEADGEVRTQ